MKTRATLMEPAASTKKGLQSKSRILKVACRKFALHGFEGTHIRDISRGAGVNLAAVCYHFRDKQGLYAAVQAQAREQLLHQPPSLLDTWPELTIQERLHAIIASLFRRLSGECAWIAQLLARELTGETQPSQGIIGEALREDLALLQAAFKEALGPAAEADAIRLSAWDVLSHCVFYCTARTALRRICPELTIQTLKDEELVRHLVGFCLRGWGNGSGKRSDPSGHSAQHQQLAG